MITKTGAQIAIKLLERQGVRTIAGIPGGANLPLYDALGRQDTIKHVLCRHEQGAGFIAQGMARVTGQPAVCFATSGPGATNVLTAIADAKLDSVPVICITGQVPSSLIGTDAFQEVDIYGMSIPITKHNFLARSAEELLDIIPEAFRIAMSGRPGPVLIDIPKDVQSESFTFDEWPEPAQPDPFPAVHQEAVQRAAIMINKAKNPVLYLGGGVVNSGAGPTAQALAEKAAIPATMTLLGLGALPSDHPRALSMLGMHAAPYTNLVLEECDLLIAAGVRFDDRATGKVEAFCPDADIIHIDIDPSEIDKIKNAHLGLVGDVGEIFESLLPLVEENERVPWSQRVENLKQEHPMVIPDENDPRSPYGIVLQAAALLDDDAVIATDVGQHQMRAAQVYPFKKPRRWLTSGGLGTMGFGMPTALGAALTDPLRKVVCFSGDGSILMNIQELATAVEQNANLKIIVINNNALGLVHQQQELFYDKRHFATQYSNHVDFVRIAQGFGMRAYDLAATDNPVAALALAFAEPGPCLIHAPVEVAENVFPMVPPGAANKEMIGGEPHVHACS